MRTLRSPANSGCESFWQTDGLYVFGRRLLIAQYLRSTTSTTRYISCPGNNIPCALTDPLNVISDEVTVATSNAHSWYEVSVQHKPMKVAPLTYSKSARLKGAVTNTRACRDLRGWLRKHDGAGEDDAGAFFDGDELICADFRKRVFLPAGPDNLDADGLTCSGFSQTKRER